jgi:hypothetical protein
MMRTAMLAEGDVKLQARWPERNPSRSMSRVGPCVFAAKTPRCDKVLADAVCAGWLDALHEGVRR